jgi:hypothetical protein
MVLIKCETATIKFGQTAFNFNDLHPIILYPEQRTTVIANFLGQKTSGCLVVWKELFENDD